MLLAQSRFQNAAGKAQGRRRPLTPWCWCDPLEDTGRGTKEMRGYIGDAERVAERRPMNPGKLGG